MIFCPQFFSQSCCLLVRLVPMLSRYSDLILFFLTMSLATHRSTAKLLSVLAQVFTELAQEVRTVHVKHPGAASTKYSVAIKCLLSQAFISDIHKQLEVICSPCGFFRALSSTLSLCLFPLRSWNLQIPH